MTFFSQTMILEGDLESTLSESKKICVSILGEKFKHKIEKSICSDIIFIDSKSKKSIGISDVRNIQKEVLLKPVECSSKIYIFKNSHNITEQAQNALLKILESPPKHVVFIFLCNNHRKLLPTLLSRSALIHVNNEEEILDADDQKTLIDAVINKNNVDILYISFKSGIDFTRLII